MPVRPCTPLLVALLAAALPAAAERPASRPQRTADRADRALECVVGIRSVRGFQGLFEWMPGDTQAHASRVLGGAWQSNGTLVDLDGIARDLSLRPAIAWGPDDIHVLTTLRNVHGASEIWIQGVAAGAGSMPATAEEPGEVMAFDSSLNLAVVRCRQPAGGFRFPRGLRLDEAPARERQAVLRPELWDWRIVRRTDELGSEGFIGHFGDPFWHPALPVRWTNDGVNFNQAGGPLIDPDSRRLVGVLASGVRQVSGPSGDEWPGDVHAIAAPDIARFLARVISGEPPRHGTLAEGGPPLVRIDPALGTLLGLPAARGVLVMADWPARDPLLRHGDVVLAAAGKPIGAGGFTLGQVAFESQPGGTLALDVMRRGEAAAVEAPVVQLDRPTSEGVGTVRFGGAWFQDLVATFRQDGDERDGAVVAHVEPGSPAEAAELGFRSVVHRVISGGRSLPVGNTRDLRAALEVLVGDESFTGEIGLLVNDLRHPESRATLSVLRLDPAGVRVESAP